MQQLIAAEVFTASTVFLVTDEDAALNMPPSTIYGMVLPGRFSLDKRTIEGAGRLAVLTTWDLSVIVTADIKLDQGDRASQWLTNSAGTIVRASQVMNALLLFDPVDENGNGLLSRPIQAAGGGVKAKPGRYGKLNIDFEVQFTWNMPTDYVSAVY